MPRATCPTYDQALRATGHYYAMLARPDWTELVRAQRVDGATRDALAIELALPGLGAESPMLRATYRRWPNTQSDGQGVLVHHVCEVAFGSLGWLLREAGDRVDRFNHPSFDLYESEYL